MNTNKSSDAGSSLDEVRYRFNSFRESLSGSLEETLPIKPSLEEKTTQENAYKTLFLSLDASVAEANKAGLSQECIAEVVQQAATRIRVLSQS